MRCATKQHPIRLRKCTKCLQVPDMSDPKLKTVPTTPEWDLGEPTALFIENVHEVF